MRTPGPDRRTRQPRVLVLDGEQRSALAVVRSLGKAGAAVYVASACEMPLAGASKHAKSVFLTPDPVRHVEDFRKSVARIVAENDLQFVLPVTDASTMLLVGTAFLGAARLLAPSAEAYEQLTDKANLLQIADAAGVLTPESRVVHSREDLVTVVEEFGFPVVLKPGRSRYLRDGCVLATAVKIVESRQQLGPVLEACNWLGDIPCIVQRFIPGTGAGVFALYGPSGPVAWFAHRRLREKPPSGGVSVLSESVAPDDCLMQAAMRLLGAANWWGPAMVEFRIAQDGTPYLMEVNGRLWGSLQLSIDAGVDFPALLLQLALNGSPPLSAGYREGQRLRWVLGDLDNLLIRLNGPENCHAKLSAVGSFIASFWDRRVRQEIFRWSDPRPSLVELTAWIRTLFV